MADLYLRRGRSSGVHDREVVVLADLTGRSPASISRRLGNFEGTAHPGRGLKPVTGEAISTFHAMATDGILRQRLVQEAFGRLAADRMIARATAPTGARLVAPESSVADTAEVQSEAVVRQILRAEAALVRRYREWLDPEGTRLHAWAIPIDGETLRTDLYDTRLHLLIEAKGAVTRHLLRQAVGQLIDYRRYLSPPPRLTVLLPDRPGEDLAALPREVGIGVIWSAGEGFHDSEDGQLTSGRDVVQQ